MISNSKAFSVDMISQYEPNVKATIAFLRLLKVRVNNGTVNETLQNHPDWPSLLSISDALTKWKIPNAGGKITKTELDQLPPPFIAYTQNTNNPLSIVTEITEKEVVYYSGNYNGPTRQDRNEFLKKWNGIYLIAEPDKNSGEENYKQQKRKFISNSIAPAALATVLIAFSSFLLYRAINSYIPGNNQAVGAYFQYLIQLAGVMVTSLLLWYEIDQNNPVLQKVCGGIAKGNCSAILTSRQAKIFNCLSWSEVGIFYFSGGFLLLICGGNLVTSIAIVSWLNILALPYTVFSIYYQWKVAKQWCVLCLAVQGLLLLGAVNIFINFSMPIPSALIIEQVIKELLVYTLPVLFWFSIKPLILRLQKEKNTKREYLRLKFNSEIFETLLKKQKSINDNMDCLGIELGNVNAGNTIIKVCNPYCGPCAKAHPKIEQLLEKNNNVKVKIIFTASNDQGDIRSFPVKHFLAIDERKDAVLTKKALDEWYLTEKKDYDRFAGKYPMNGELELQDEKIETMHSWCKENGIEATPTFFVNGHQLPSAYSIEDLEYFLAE